MVYISFMLSVPMRKSLSHRLYSVEEADLNAYGIMHGGRLLTVADESAFFSAYLHSGGTCLTRAVHRARFHHAVQHGDVIELISQVAWVGRSSLWVPIRVQRQGSEKVLMDAVFVFVALDGQFRPRLVAGAIAESEEEIRMQQQVLDLRKKAVP